MLNLIKIWIRDHQRGYSDEDLKSVQSKINSVTSMGTVIIVSVHELNAWKAWNKGVYLTPIDEDARYQ